MKEELIKEIVELWKEYCRSIPVYRDVRDMNLSHFMDWLDEQRTVKSSD